MCRRRAAARSALVGLDLHTGGAARPVRVVDLASERDLEDLCGASIVWRQAAEAFEAVLARTSAADLAERERVQIAASPCIRSDPRSSRTNRRRYP